MTGLFLVWLLAAVGGTVLALLAFCFLRNMGRAFFQAVSVETNDTQKQVTVAG